MDQKNIEFNGVEYEVKSLIEFSSLTRLLFDLAKRQKELENKYEYMNEHILDKEQRVSDLELKVIGESRPFQKKYDKDSFSNAYKPSKFKNDSIKKQNYFENNISNVSNSNNSNNEEKTGNKEEKFDSINNNKINTDVISKLYKKIKDIEKQLNEINIKSNNDILPEIRKNHDNIIKSKNQIHQLDKNYEEVNKKLIKLNEEFDKIKIKVEDFNIYDVFKSDSGEGGGVDAAKALIMNLENKIFKKFSLYDDKNKKNESDLFKIIEDMKNLKGLIDNFKIQNQRGNEKMNDIEKNLSEYINKNDNKIDEITNNIELLEKKIKKGFEVDEMMNNFNKKIKNIEEELTKNINNSINNIKDTKDSTNNILVKKKIEDFDKAIKEITKNINDIDKNLNQNINNVENSLKEKISILEKEIQKKIELTNLNPINDKIYGLEELTKSLVEQIDTLHQYNEKFKSDISNLNKKLEYINGQFLELKTSNENNKLKVNSDFNINSLIDQTKFNEYKKENNLKNEKLRMIIDEVSLKLNEISSSISQFSTNKDFIHFQNNLMNLLEEFKSNCFRKFMDKQEINKNLRILENQIKTISETYKKSDTANNWLLAKKPLNNYQCASCEALLKNLEKKDNYVAWNKYPNREEKTYRMGHGFSRMLQMVNEEIIKNIENKEKGYVSDEDKKYINNNKSKFNDSSVHEHNKSIKLPKVEQKNVNNEKYGLTVNKFRINTTPYEDADSASPDEPKISKIYKINNHGRKLFGLNKTTNTENHNNISVNTSEIKHKFKDKIRFDYLQMSMTQLNEKK